MKIKDLVKLGSQTAKRGFKNEKDIAEKFNNWKADEDAQKWLGIMGYLLDEIEKVEAIQLHGYKTDVQVQITIYLKGAIAAENLSVKLVSNPQGFNQIDKRWVDKYVEMWNLPENLTKILKLFTGEISPATTSEIRDVRRMFFDEMPEEDQERVVNYFTKNKILVISDVLKGRGKFSAGWMLVALVMNGKGKWILKTINEAMNVFADGPIEITSQGSLRIGKIGMQRKGGDNGKPSANMLQFKINPVLLFDKE